MNNKYQILGIHCASCKYYIEDTLSQIDGVKNIQVNVADNSAYLDFDNEKTSIVNLNKAIGNAGYEIQENTSNISTTKQKIPNSMPKSLKIGLVFVAISFFMMILELLMNFKVIQLSEVVEEFFHHLMPIMATFMIVSLGKDYINAIWNFLKTRHANMNTLVGIGVMTAFIYSFLITAFESTIGKTLGTGNYYDVVIVLLGLISLGKYFEEKAKRKTTDAVRKLIESGVKSAFIKNNDGEISEIDLDLVQIKDIVIIKQGMKVPVDGKIIFGSGDLNESSLTGESRLISKSLNNFAFAGTTLENGYIEISATGIGESSKLGQITKLVENAMNSKAEIQNLVDKIASKFVPIVLVISILSLIFWILVGIISGNFSEYSKVGIICFVSVLVVACPCSLGLATPLAVAVGIGEAAKNGILFKSADSLQKIKDCDVLIFDKTGTITEGKMKIIDTKVNLPAFSHLPFQGGQDEVLQIATSLESQTTHPIAMSFLELNKLDLLEVTDFQNIGGMGISGIINSKNYKLGNAKFTNVSEVDSQNTIIYLSENDNLIAIFELADTLKADITNVLSDLRSKNLKVILATGDKDQVGKEIGKLAGFQESEIFTELMPEDKLSLIQKFQSEGKVVAMIGDGVNDSPALAQADIGIAMGNGTDIAIETAEITILGGDLTKLETMFEIAKKTFRKIKENLFWAFGYNIILIPLAAGLFYPFLKLLLSPIIAGVAMSLSSLSVTLNSLRIRK